MLIQVDVTHFAEKKYEKMVSAQDLLTWEFLFLRVLRAL